MSETIELRDPSIGLRGVIAIHSTSRGPAFGGIRRQAYASDDDARADALRLAEAMSFKCALAGLPAGGGKTVLVAGPDADVDAVYDAVGREVERLGGRYVCGPDIGTGAAELARVRAQTRWVNPEGNDPAASTAAGVLAGMRAVWHWYRVEPIQRYVVAIQGLGAVGLALARMLRELDVSVVGADVDASRVELARAIGVEIIDPHEILAGPYFIVAPCAGGGVLSRDSVATLGCMAVCGSANNQIVDDDAAFALVDRGIIHVPDVVASAGAVIEGVRTMQQGQGPDVRAAIAENIAALERVASRILVDARARSRPESHVAREQAVALLQR